ncbi:MAG: carboxylating nicotinate-nucleotide diphosphorylase [Bacteroidales bacterium]
MKIKDIIAHAIAEDHGSGDHTSLATIPETATGSARLKANENGIISGVDIASAVFLYVDNSLKINSPVKNGSEVNSGDIIFTVEGSASSILQAERVALNFIQRMSGIATTTSQYASQIKEFPATILDTRKTTPLMRELEKRAVKDGGGANHRMGLYDMIMIKDNHIDFAGGIPQAIDAANTYLAQKNLSIPIEIEVRNFDELNQVLNHKPSANLSRIMLDNFSPENLIIAIQNINKRFETEASGGITLNTIRDYAVSGVDYISVGALTHHIKSLDMSLKANF